MPMWSSPRFGSDIEYYLRKMQRLLEEAQRDAELGLEGRHAPEYYLSAAGHGREPPGFWAGKGAAGLGLKGNVDPEVMTRLFMDGIAPDGTRVRPGRGEFERLAARARENAAELARLEGPYTTSERRREILGQEMTKVRVPNCLIDQTFSAPKSWSLAHAGYLAAAREARQAGDLAQAEEHEATAGQIVDTIGDIARLAVKETERTACFVRTGHHSATSGEWRDAKGLTAAVFVQMTSRDGDPQLHAHVVMLNAAQRADGADHKWRALDGSALINERLHVATIVGLCAQQKMGRLGFRMVARADGAGAEIAGVDQATMDAFSSRRATITPEVRKLADAYAARHGHPPTQNALWSMRQHVTLATRKAKAETERTADQELDAWEETSRRAQVQMLAQLPGAIGEATPHGGASRPF